ncbi:MAG TPA: ATP-binding protein [Geminicoccus sp.]|jgi:signal transduction histidine kinase|uniref:ATP-binding protein n=1 Tax=Geminicoccus sp. TaxID=2024832 RepID=UPI002E31CC47|nr:ATP-binding protein [Geminicoccus sp.]HEX2528124.1 ATP-binding protein [Geminicoccus sp.]
MNIYAATQTLRDRVWIGYVLALAGPVLILWIRFALGSALIGVPFLAFLLTVIVATFIGGMGAGILATLMSAVLAGYYLFEPASPNHVVPDRWLVITFYVLISGVLILFVQFMNRAMGQLSASQQELSRLNETLEQRIAERTQELAAANAQLKEEIRTRESAEAQMRQVQKMEAVGQLTGGIAHDFNNMLAVIVGSLDMAQRRLKRGDSDILRFLEDAMDGAERAASLTQRLLAFSRQQPLAPVVSDVNALVGSMSELLRRTLGEHFLLECVLAGGLWRTRVDPGQLENAVLNLAVNARDAMPAGGRLTIETLNARLDDAYAAAHAEVEPGQYVVVAVSDTGTGMPVDIAARAFDPFFTTKAPGQGTGLGLSQVYGFVKQSGGHVKIYSEPGQGTTVKIYLRREMERLGGGEAGSGAELQPAMPKGSRSELILVVEDDAGVRTTSVGALQELGYSVRDAASGEEALAILEEQPDTSLLFTDVVMPGMSGRQLAEAALARLPHLKVLYTTGYTPNAIVHSGVVDPGVELMTKPFALDQLARKVRSVLDGRLRRD